MIHPYDAYILARTKFRTRRVRTSITVVVSGLLFGILCFALFVVGGVTRSVAVMSEKSMAGRYIVSGYQSVDFSTMDTGWENPELIKKASDMHTQLVADKTREAKRIGVDYDPKSESLPYDIVDGKTGQKRLSYSSPIAQQILTENAREKNPYRTLDDFKKFADRYQPASYYIAAPLVSKDGQVVEMQKGKEKLEGGDTNIQTGGAPDDYQQMILSPQALLRNYMFESPGWSPDSGHIPVVVTQKRAAAVTGFSMPKDAPAQDRLQYINQLRQKAKGATFSMCYRNSKSKELLAQALMTKKEIQAQSGNKEYRQPSVVYGVPDDTTCGEPSIVRDTRSAAEKTRAAKQKEFDALFGMIVDPVQHKLTYEIVGVAPNSFMDESSDTINANTLVDSLFSNMGFRFAIPEEMYDQVSEKFGYNTIFNASNTHQSGMPDWIMMNEAQYFAEFTSADHARSFVKNESCKHDYNGCMPRDKWFMLSPFGSNSIAMEDAWRIIERVLLWAGVATILLAAIICGATVGRAIADGRRETAVFRAIGFKRMDVSQVYVVYMMMICIEIVLFAFVIGAVGALVVDGAFWVDATARARVLLGLYEDASIFRFIGLLPHHLAIAGAVFAAGLLGTIVPLIRNMRRNPIRDMRDE